MTLSTLYYSKKSNGNGSPKSAPVNGSTAYCGTSMYVKIAEGFSVKVHDWEGRVMFAWHEDEGRGGRRQPLLLSACTRVCHLQLQPIASSAPSASRRRGLRTCAVAALQPMMRSRR